MNRRAHAAAITPVRGLIGAALLAIALIVALAPAAKAAKRDGAVPQGKAGKKAAPQKTGKKKARKPARIRPFRTGVSYVYREEAEDPATMQHVREAGASMVLVPLEWGRVVPETRPAAWNPEDPADPNYDWKPYDIWVQSAVANGLTPIFQLRGAPPWANRCAFIALDTPCDLNPADLYSFAVAAARRYSGAYPGLPKVTYWQGLNEPNLSLFFEPQYVNGQAASAELYRVLINTFYAAVKAVDPTNLVINGGLGPIAVPKFTIGPLQFTRELLCMKGRDKYRPAPGDCGGGVNFDIYDIHPYTTGSPAHEGGKNDVQLGSLQRLVDLLAAADKAGRINSVYKKTPLWIIELSYDSNPPDPGGLPDYILTRWTAEAMHNAWKAGITNFFWFSLRDFAPNPKLASHESLESGLFMRGATPSQDQPKAVFYAFRFPFTAYQNRRGKISFWGRTPTSQPGKVVIQARQGPGWKRIGVTRAAKNGVFVGEISSRYGTNRKGFVRAHYKKGASVPFSMKRIGDFKHAPFGDPVG